ncbi:MAG: DUF1206 domain-containing protein [Planctomycetes bacterium]|nr:DUF1206 domain-containing protein [Planctomycetota bacterium]
MAHGAVHQKVDHLAAEHGRWIEWAGRIGFATKGVVFAIVGAMAVAAAWRGGRAEGSHGAIREIGQQPFGQVLLWLTAIGLVAYALWRFVQAAVDPGRRGAEWKDIARRIGYFIVGLIYVGLAIYAAPVSIIGAGGDTSENGLAAMVLEYPGGRFLLGLVGAAVLGLACFELRLASTQNFMRDYKPQKMREPQRKIAKIAGVVGLTARGITFLIVGFFVILAAWKLDPSETKSFGEALEVLADQPYGPWLLAITGVGLICYAVYCGSLAVYRRFAA